MVVLSNIPVAEYPKLLERTCYEQIYSAAHMSGSQKPHQEKATSLASAAIHGVSSTVAPCRTAVPAGDPGYPRTEGPPVRPIESLRLMDKIVGDVVVGSSVTFLIAPALAVVDKAIVENAAGTKTVLESAMISMRGIATNPLSFVRSPSFLLMWAVYASTYSTANSLKTIVEHKSTGSPHSRKRPSAINSSHDDKQVGKMAVFLGTTLVNTSASLLKDRAYAQMFSNKSSTSPLPRVSYGFWMMRDFTVIGSAFILPDHLSYQLSERTGMSKKEAEKTSQLLLPVAAQFVAGPLHFLGLDFYNRQNVGKTWSQAVGDRVAALRRAFGPVVSARIARIAPGYSIGGVLNTHWRDQWRESLHCSHTTKSIKHFPTGTNTKKLD